VPPEPEPATFESRLLTSFERLGVEWVDFLSLHGINAAKAPALVSDLTAGGCLDVARRW